MRLAVATAIAAGTATVWIVRNAATHNGVDDLGTRLESQLE